MKAALLALVLATIAPRHITLGPVTLPAWQVLVLGEALAVAAGAWLAVRVMRRYWARPWPRLAYGGAW
ncbi:MAG TPA: hypothetical protein VGF32_28925 [Streptosporangiaceae bacterium]|jgi:uncharacterized membrane protein YfcA